MGAVIHDRWVRINDIALAQAGVYAKDLSDMDKRAAIRGDDQLAPYHQGQIPRRRWVDRTRKLIPVRIDGMYDLDDVVQAEADYLSTIRDTLDVLNAAFRPRHDTRAGTSPIEYHLADGSVREGRCHVLDFAGSYVNGSRFWDGVVDFSIPTGVLLGEDPVTQTLTVGSNAVTNPGTAEAFDMVLEFTDAARLENTSWGDDLWLDYTGDQALTIDTETSNARYADDTSAVNEVDNDGHERLFALAPGANTIVVTGSAVDLTFYPPYL